MNPLFPAFNHTLYRFEAAFFNSYRIVEFDRSGSSVDGTLFIVGVSFFKVESVLISWKHRYHASGSNSWSLDLFFLYLFFFFGFGMISQLQPLRTLMQSNVHIDPPTVLPANEGIMRSLCRCLPLSSFPPCIENSTLLTLIAH